MSIGYYEKNKERVQKRLEKGIKIFQKKKKTKSISIAMNDIEIFQRIKNKKS